MTISKFPPENPAVVMSDTQPSTKVDGTIWVDTDSDVPVVNPTDYVRNSLFANKGTIAAASAASTPAALSAGSNGQMLMADSSATAGLRYVDPPANRNLIYNGAMQVHQRSASSAGITTTGYYTADRWQTINTTLGTWTQTVEVDGPTGSGFTKSLKMLCTTSDNSPAAGDQLRVRQLFEGQDLQRIKKGTSAAEQITVSFWVKSNVTGTYIVDLYDTVNMRSVGSSYTVSASETWEKKTITFPADTTGSFANDNAVALSLSFFLGAGSNRTSGTLQTSWYSTVTANEAVGQTNLAAATNNYWQITGVQLETGPVATPFEFEPYEATLRKCQRYYYLHVSGGGTKAIGFGGYYTNNAIKCFVHLPVPMRTAPSLEVATGTDYYGFERVSASDTFNTFTIQGATETTGMLSHNADLSGTAGDSGWFYTNNASSKIAYAAEL